MVMGSEGVFRVTGSGTCRYDWNFGRIMRISRDYLSSQRSRTDKSVNYKCGIIHLPEQESDAVYYQFQFFYVLFLDKQQRGLPRRTANDTETDPKPANRHGFQVHPYTTPSASFPPSPVLSLSWERRR